MSFISKIKNAVANYPKLATFSIGFAMTFALGTTIGIIDQQQVEALLACSGCLR